MRGIKKRSLKLFSAAARKYKPIGKNIIPLIIRAFHDFFHSPHKIKNRETTSNNQKIKPT
jgi:hypothetical protein